MLSCPRPMCPRFLKYILYIYINKYINNLFVIRKYIFLYGTMIQHRIVKRKVIGSRTLGPILSNNALRNIPFLSSELVELTRSVRRKSVPTPWYSSLCHRSGWRSFLLTLFAVYFYYTAPPALSSTDRSYPHSWNDKRAWRGLIYDALFIDIYTTKYLHI